MTRKVAAPMSTGKTPGLALNHVQRGRGTAAPLFRYLLLLLLLTPLLAGIRLLIGREAPPPEVQIVTQIVEVPQPIYIEIPVPTVVVIRVPADPSTPVSPRAVAGGGEGEPPVEVAAAPQAGPAPSPVGSSSLGGDGQAASQLATDPADGRSATVSPRPTLRIVAEAPPAPLPVVAETASPEEPGETSVAQAPVSEVEQEPVSYAEPGVDPPPLTPEVTPTPVLVTIAVTTGRGSSSRSGNRNSGSSSSDAGASTATPVPTSTAAPTPIFVSVPTATATPKPKPTPKKV